MTEEDTFGTKLRGARERRGISLRTIANETRISVTVLEALERDDIARLPGGIFTRAFVRSYAAQVGLDPEETIRTFIAAFPHDSITAGHTPSEPVDDSVESDRLAAKVFLRLVVFSLPVAATILYLVSR
jgi:cytoskeletal protein RodZ